MDIPFRSSFNMGVSLEDKCLENLPSKKRPVLTGDSVIITGKKLPKPGGFDNKVILTNNMDILTKCTSNCNSLTNNGRGAPKQTGEEDQIKIHMEQIRKVVSWKDDVSDVVGHTKVKAALDSAFLIANSLAVPLDSSIVCTHVLIAGLGGLGKTELMKSQAVKASKLIKKEISVFNVKSADLLSKYIGDSEKAISALWDVVERHSPSLVIFDEVDGLMKSRTDDESDATRRFKNALLSELRGNRQLKNVVVVAATNKANDIDDNFLSRFKLRYVVKPPTESERRMLFDKFFRVCEPAMEINYKDIDYDVLLQRTGGFSGNDIGTLIGLAASHSLRIFHNGREYKVEELDSIREELERMDSPAKAVLLPLSMESILKALQHVKPSCLAMDVKHLNKWAQKWCKDMDERQEQTAKFEQDCCDSCCLCDLCSCCCSSCLPF